MFLMFDDGQRGCYQSLMKPARKPVKVTEPKANAPKAGRTVALPALPSLSPLKAAGVKAVEVRFFGHGDDGHFECRAIGARKEIPDDASKEIESFLCERFMCSGEGDGNYLLARFDLETAECIGLQGFGDPEARLAELLIVLEARGCSEAVCEVKSHELSKCQAEPRNSLSSQEVSEHIEWFLGCVQAYQAEHGDDSELSLDNENGKFLEGLAAPEARTLRVDVTARSISLLGSGLPKVLKLLADRPDAKRYGFRF